MSWILAYRLFMLVLQPICCIANLYLVQRNYELRGRHFWVTYLGLAGAALCAWTTATTVRSLLAP